MESIFHNSEARVLDRGFTVGNMVQTIPMLAESTGLDYKSVQHAVGGLVRLQLMQKSEIAKGTQTYTFDTTKLRGLAKWVINWSWGFTAPSLGEEET